MRIVHFAPFAPCACGLYEAARDMIIADRMSGNESYLVDTGITTCIKGEYKHELGASGKIDERGGTEIVSEDSGIAFKADILVAHTGGIDSWIVQCQAPLIWILHGRPVACFRPEQYGGTNSYSLVASLAKWPRIKAMITFWESHIEFWKLIIPEEKLVCFSAPPIDEKRFSSEGTRHDFGIMGGKYNIMIAESWREDIDIYEIVHGAIEFAKTNHDVRFHLYSLINPLPACWELLIAELRRLNALGELWERRPNIEEIYRAADILLSPQKIVTRTVGEALSCGTPVIADYGCTEATWNANPAKPQDIASTLEIALAEIENKSDVIKYRVKESASQFTLKKYSKQMNALYERITT